MSLFLLDCHVRYHQALPLSRGHFWPRRNFRLHVSFPPRLLYFHLASGARNKKERGGGDPRILKFVIININNTYMHNCQARVRSPKVLSPSLNPSYLEMEDLLLPVSGRWPNLALPLAPLYAHI